MHEKIFLTAICLLLLIGSAFGESIFTDISSQISMTGVQVIGDVNGDGWPDLLNNNGIWLNKGQIIDGKPAFQHVEQGLDFTQKSLSQMILVDIDGDGDKDLVAAERYSDARLYRNDSCGNELRFSDITEEVGLGGRIGHEQTHIALSDIDKDGDLDIYLTEGWPSGKGGVLYRNDTNENGINFTDVTAASGIVAPQACRTILFNDYDGDGDPDLYLGSHNGYKSVNKLYLNRGDINNDGVPDFLDVTSKAGLINYSGYDNGATAGDIDNDGDIDIVQAVSWGTDSGSVKIFKNAGDTNKDGIVDFIDVTINSGIASAIHHGVGLGDIDNDGDLDLADASWQYSPLQFYANRGDGTFTNITEDSGIGYLTDGIRTLFADIDNDGDLDIWMNKLFMNNTNNDNFIKVELLGEGLNRDAIGAKLRVWPEGKSHSTENLVAYREVTAGTAFFSSDDSILELGLMPGAYDLEATFMSGTVQLLTGVQTGRNVQILEGSNVFFPNKCGNTGPTADAGPDQVIESTGAHGTYVALDGQLSYDPDGDTLSYEWTEDGNIISTSMAPMVILGLGTHTLVLTVADGNGGSAQDSVMISIRDITPPNVNLTTSTNTIWPPNHKMVNVMVNGSASDSGSDVASVMINVTDEYGVYNMTVPGFGSTIQLEAWREGTDKDGRHYTVTAVITDMAGNQSTATTEILVPHDMR